MGVQINGSEGNVIATKGTFSGDVGIGGTLTYEDVTNIDSVGLVTARSGIEVGARPGVAASISVDGNAIFSGISTFGGVINANSNVNISNKTIGIGTNGKIGIGTNVVTDNNVFVEIVGSASQLSRLQFNNKPVVGTDNAEIGGIVFRNNNDSVANISCLRESAADDAYIQFATQETGGGITERLRIHSDGKMSLGTSSSTTAKFNISHGNEFGLYTSGPYNFQAKFESTDAEAGIVIEDVNSTTDANRIGVVTNDMTFITNNAERLRIDSSGRVMFGTTTLGESGADDLTIENTSADMGITLRTGTTRNASLFFADGTSSSAQYSGYIQYAHNGDYMVLGTNGQETMRMHSDKRISVNTATKYGMIHSLEDQFNPDNEKWLTDAAFVASGSFGGGYALLDGSKGYSMFCADNGNDLYIRHHASTSSGASGGVYLDNAATSWTGASDEREKENLVTISDAITKIKTLRTVTGNYTWQPDERHAFLIAQDVQAVLPEAVSVTNKHDATEDQRLSLRYTEVIPLLVKAMQEQQEEIESLKARLDAAGL